MYRLSGQVTDAGTAVAGQPVVVVDTADSDPTNWTVVGGDQTDAEGQWSVAVPTPDVERYHAVAQFSDSGTLKNAESKPFLTGQPVVGAAAVSLDFDAKSAGTAISDIVINQLTVSEGSGSTVGDSIGSADATVNGPDWVTGTYKDNYALQRNGSGQVEDFDATYLQTAGNITGPWTVIYTVENPVSTGGVHIGASNGGGVSGLLFGNKDFYGNPPTDTANLGVQEAAGDNLTVYGSTDITDGNKYRIAWTLNGNTLSDVSLFINGSSESLSADRDETPSGFNDLPPFYWFADNESGSADKSGDATIDNVVVADAVLSSSQIQDDYEDQPWSHITLNI